MYFPCSNICVNCDTKVPVLPTALDLVRSILLNPIPPSSDARANRVEGHCGVSMGRLCRYNLGPYPSSSQLQIAEMPDPELGIIEPFPHDVGQAGSSIALTHVEENTADQSRTPSMTPKISQFQEEVPSRGFRRRNLALNAAGWVNERYPRTARAFTRVFYYIRGPRPIVAPPGKLFNVCFSLLISLLAPVGLVDRTWKVRGKECEVFWEKYVLHFTHPFKRSWIFWPLAIAYLISLAFFARANYFFTPAESFIDCTAAYWQRLDGCGLNGADCQPFTDAGFEFRCPAGCMETTLQNIRTVGNLEVIYEPLVVGGGDNNRTYRGDSFLCAAAIHA